jgi:3'(2'), 5'-bisphosphate nucleotidase
MSWQQELETTLAIALEAAALINTLRTRPVPVHEKAGGEPVTDADLAANDLIVGRLAQRFPQDAILSEESPAHGDRRRAPRLWMIDPIDGTRDFIRGESGFAVMIGLCLEGAPTLGVVAQPATGITWLGARDLGAWRITAPGTREAITASVRRDPASARLVSSKSRRDGYYNQFCAALGITDERLVGSVGIKLGLIADGSRDLCVYPGPQTKLWDTCAPQAILEAAGGKVTDALGAPLVYTGETLRNERGLVASNGQVHGAALEAIATIRAARPAGR